MHVCRGVYEMCMHILVYRICTGVHTWVHAHVYACLRLCDLCASVSPEASVRCLPLSFYPTDFLRQGLLQNRKLTDL